MKLDHTYSYHDSGRIAFLRGLSKLNGLEILFVYDKISMVGAPLQVKNHVLEHKESNPEVTEWVVSLINALLMGLE